MSFKLNPYLRFHGKAKEAMEFYHGVFGGQLTMTTMGEMQPDLVGPDAERIMHAQLDTDHLTLMASDGFEDAEPAHTESNVSLALTGTDEAALRSFWDGLSSDGTVTQPLVDAPWGGAFGMVVDRFGTDWMFNIQPAPTAQRN